jgi:hypothetical protein
MAAENEAPDDFISEEEFRERMKDPEFVKVLNEHYRKVINSSEGEQVPELVELAKRALKCNETHATMEICQKKLEEIMALVRRPGGTMRAEDRHSQLNRLVDEYLDLGLDLAEPHRTVFLKDFVDMREYVKSLRVPE